MRYFLRLSCKIAFWGTLSLLAPAGEAAAQGASQCPIPPNPGQCICHNITGGSGEICTSRNAIVNGHNAHILCYNLGGVSCSVQDKCGKCNGCGNGVLTTGSGEECDDGNNVSGDGCDTNCKVECRSNADCDDSNPCTDDICGTRFSCTHVNNAAPCNDGNLCTENDLCSGGACSPGGTKDCSDAIKCSVDSCDPGTGICRSDASACECETDADCDDANTCTDEVCNTQNTCVRSDNSDPCDDGLFCNGTDTCGEGSCSIHSGDPCGAGSECADACDEEANNCNDPAGTSCADDGNTCTDNLCNGLGQCVPLNNSVDCDDGDACSLGDLCAGGLCMPGPPKICSDDISCTVDSCDSQTGDCSSDSSACECETEADCDDGNACTDEFCDDQNTCVRSDNSNACDDGLFCNGTDTCGEGSCSVHSGDPCSSGGECADACNEEANNCHDPAGTACDDDGNGCTDNFCNGQGECATSNNASVCDDNNPCTLGDACSGGLCAPGSPKNCDDGIECSIDSCAPQTGECHSETGACECEADVDCDDGNACTDEFCNGQNTCVRSDNSDACDDGLFCNGLDTCGGGSCSVHSGDPCGAGSECADACDEEANNCNDPAGTPCTDDGNVCTDNLCNGQGTCSPSNNTSDCDDGNACTMNDVCSSGQCTAGFPKNCGDGVECTSDSCDSETGECSHDVSGCECEADSDCDDGNACTDEFCDDQNTCARSNNSATCDDGLFCNGADTCREGSCGVHSGDPCRMGGECADACNEEADDCNEPSGAPCSDDGNACTDNLCNGEGECSPSNNTADCDDNNACTLNDLCSEGSCTPGAPKDCSDGRACSTDSCIPQSGQCTHDLSLCVCSSDAACDDQNPCTLDSCNLSAGTCSNAVQTGATCDDGSLCTEKDLCDEAGACLGSSLDCDDGNTCTDDSCEAGQGCLNVTNGSCDPGTPPLETPPGEDGPVIGGPPGVFCIEGSGNATGNKGTNCKNWGCSLNPASSAKPSSGSALMGFALSLCLASASLWRRHRQKSDCHSHNFR